MVRMQMAQSVEVVRGNSRRRLGLDRHGHVSNNEIDLDPAGQPPVVQIGAGFLIGIARDQFMKHPILERLPEEFAAGLHAATFRQVIGRGPADLR